MSLPARGIAQISFYFIHELTDHGQGDLRVKLDTTCSEFRISRILKFWSSGVSDFRISQISGFRVMEFCMSQNVSKQRQQMQKYLMPCMQGIRHGQMAKNSSYCQALSKLLTLARVLTVRWYQRSWAPCVQCLYELFFVA